MEYGRQGDYFRPRIFAAADDAVETIEPAPWRGFAARFRWAAGLTAAYPAAMLGFAAGYVAGVAVASFRNGLSASE